MKHLEKVMLLFVVGLLQTLFISNSEIKSQTIFKVPANPYETCIVDYDHDGDNDIVVGCSGPNQDPDSLIIFFNDGWGNFEFEKFQIPNQIELNCIDLTGDNYPDIITQTIDNMIFYENDKNGGISDDYMIMNIDCSPKIGGIADINNDNINDIVYYCRSIPYSWGVQFNNGENTFTDSSFVVGSETTIHPSVGHLNNDDQPDILVTTINPDDSIYILYNNYPVFTQYNITSAVWRPGFILKVNSDNENDITLFQPLYFGPATIENYLNNNESFNLCNRMQFVNGSRIQNTCDYNLDGYDDIAISVYQANNQPIEDSIYVYFNDQDCGYPHVQSIYMGDYGWLPSAKHGDLNGDGYPELVIQGYHFPRDNIRVLWNDGTGHFIDTNSVSVYQNEIELTTHINIYPNPSSGNISIRSSLKKIKTVTLLDMSGRTLFEQNWMGEKNTIELNLSNLPVKPGIYLCAIQLENEILVFRKIIFTKP